jgi:serine/threonine protein kinase
MKEDEADFEKALGNSTIIYTVSENYGIITKSLQLATSTLYTSVIDISQQKNKGRVAAVFQGSSNEDYEDLRIIKAIGKGGFSEVFQAIDEKTKKEFAMRLCKIDGKNYPQERAFKEIDTYNQLRHIDHPNIAKIYSAKVISSTDEGNEFQSLQVIMELGVCTLEDVFSNRAKYKKPWTEIELLHIAAMIVHPLQIAKEHGISHRDISLNNIILDKDLKNYKLIDFAEVS